MGKKHNKFYRHISKRLGVVLVCLLLDVVLGGTCDTCHSHSKGWGVSGMIYIHKV